MTMPFKYFHYDEFDSPDSIGSGIAHMDENFISALDDAREAAGIPFRITSGYRTPEHNAAIAGSPTSSHLKGVACDILCEEPEDMLRMVASLGRAGFTRIGININDSFIHVDADTDKPDAYWFYG